MHRSVIYGWLVESDIARTRIFEEKMTITEFLPLLLIAMVAANIGQLIFGYSLGRYVMSLIVSFIGAFFGIGIARLFGFPELLPFIIRGEMFPLMWSMIGAGTLSWAWDSLTRGAEIDYLITQEVNRRE